MEQPPERGRRAARQTETIATLRAEGAIEVAARLARCMAARAARHRDAWPWRCRSAGCAWCGPPAARRWWRGLIRWAEGAGDVTVTVVLVPAGSVGAAPRLRRALRDVRDRAAIRDARWRAVAVGGMLDVDLRAIVLVLHPVRLPRADVERALRRRWRGAIYPEVLPDPQFVFPPKIAATLARARRGVEPLRAVVMPQRPRAERGAASSVPALEPMPIAFAIGGDAESFSGLSLGTDTLGR